MSENEKSKRNNCNACGCVLLLSNANVDDGCPCNSRRGANVTPRKCALCLDEECAKPAHHMVGFEVAELRARADRDMADLVARANKAEAAFVAVANAVGGRISVSGAVDDAANLRVRAERAERALVELDGCGEKAKAAKASEMAAKAGAERAVEEALEHKARADRLETELDGLRRSYDLVLKSLSALSTGAGAGQRLPARPDYVPPADVRSYMTDDADIDPERHRLDVFRGDNGDWYVSIMPAADRFSRACVRVTTSGSRNYKAPIAVHALWEALAPEAKRPPAESCLCDCHRAAVFPGPSEYCEGCAGGGCGAKAAADDAPRSRCHVHAGEGGSQCKHHEGHGGKHSWEPREGRADAKLLGNMRVGILARYLTEYSYVVRVRNASLWDAHCAACAAAPVANNEHLSGTCAGTEAARELLALLGVE